MTYTYKLLSAWVKVMTYIGWARVSTQDQSLEQQVKRLDELGCVKVFEPKHSGKAESNEGKLKEMLELAKNLAMVKDDVTVVVTKLDRLGRSLAQVLQVVDTLTEMGVSLKALDQPIDTSKDDYMAKAMVQLLGMFAEMERNMIVERTQAGRVASGNLGGRPKSYTPEQEKEILEKMKEGMSDNKLSKEYGIHRATLGKIRKASGIKPIRPAS